MAMNRNAISKRAKPARSQVLDPKSLVHLLRTLAECYPDCIRTERENIQQILNILEAPKLAQSPAQNLELGTDSEGQEQGQVHGQNNKDASNANDTNDANDANDTSDVNNANQDVDQVCSHAEDQASGDVLPSSYENSAQSLDHRASPEVYDIQIQLIFSPTPVGSFIRLIVGFIPIIQTVIDDAKSSPHK
jgi:hypothetical protein